MADQDKIEALQRLLAETADAHHKATGGPDSNWAGWYADYLHGKIDEQVGFSPDVETLAAWLTAADERHRTKEPEIKYWPTVYARYILEDYATEG